MTSTSKTKASEALRLTLGKERGAAARLWKQLGCSHSLVSRWCYGTRMPDAAQAAYIETKYRIPCRWWRLPAEVEGSLGSRA